METGIMREVTSKQGMWNTMPLIGSGDEWWKSE